MHMGRVFVGIVIVISMLFSVSMVVLNRSHPVQGVVSYNPANVSEALPLESTDRIVAYQVKDGDTWGKIAEAAGIGNFLGAKLLAISDGAHSLASIRSGNLLKFYFKNSSGLDPDLLKIEYDVDSENILIIENDGTGSFSARKEKIDYRINLVVKSGSIESSLFETATAQGIPAEVILNMATIFGWDIDFASSVQKGDSFSILYEDRFRGEQYAGPGKILAAKFINSGREFYAFRYEDNEGIGRYYNSEGRELKRQFLRSPLDYTRITSGFSYNRFHPILNTFTTHRAVDYAVADGTPVSATADGTVNYVGWKGGNGMYIGIKHANAYETGYAHLSAYAKDIRVGAKVKQNQVIGFVGSTGLSTGAHLHYEMRKNGVLINPLRLDLPPGKMLSEEQFAEFYTERDRLIGLLKK